MAPLVQPSAKAPVIACRGNPAYSEGGVPRPRLDLQAAFTGSIGQSLDLAVEQEAAAVEVSFFDAGLLGALGDRRADFGRRFDVVLANNAQILLQRRSRSERYAVHIVDQLDADVLVGAVNRQAQRPRSLCEVCSGRACGASGTDLFCCLPLSASLLLLAFLAEDILVFVLDALALVGLGLAPFADIRRDLADELLINAFDDDLGRLRRGDCHTLGHFEVHVVAVAKRQLQGVALHLSPVTNAADLKLFLEALGTPVTRLATMVRLMPHC